MVLDFHYFSRAAALAVGLMSYDTDDEDSAGAPPRHHRNPMVAKLLDFLVPMALTGVVSGLVAWGATSVRLSYVERTTEEMRQTKVDRAYLDGVLAVSVEQRNQLTTSAAEIRAQLEAMQQRLNSMERTLILLEAAAQQRRAR